ncbi:MAG TPA: HAD family hydrolase [Polyangium sp.]|nr:HAD family hydrolase [Polyangium sp.]
MSQEHAIPTPLPNECCISVTTLIERLAHARKAIDNPDVMLAFDADGTLWSGDVGNDLFHALIAEQGVREVAQAALMVEAGTFGLDTSGSPTELAQRLFEAHETGQYPEDRCFAMMAWVFAGRSLDETITFSRRVMQSAKLEERLHRFLDPLFAWTQKEKIAVWVVSASPKWMVELGVAMFGIPNHQVIGMTPVVENGFVLPRLAGKPIYGPNKPTVLRETCPQSTLLGGFGDSSYDVPLLQMAKVPVAIRPKPSLLAKAHDVSNLVAIGI